MLSTLRTVSSLLLSYGLLLLGNGLLSTLLGVRTRIEGFTPEVVGFIASGYFLGLLLGAFRAVSVVSAVGHIRAFAAFASVMSVTVLLHVLWVEPLAWWVMRGFAGFCMAGMVMVTESWLNERCTNRMRGQVMSFYMITNYFAAGCGQFILPLGDPGSFQLFSVVSILFSLALVPVLLTRASAPRPAPKERPNFRELWHTSPLGLVGALCAGILNATFYGVGPIFALGVGLSLVGTSTFMATVIFGGLLLQWPVGKLSDHVDRRTILTIVAAGTSATCVWLAVVASRGGASLFLPGLLYGGLSFTVYSLAIAHTNDFARPDRLIQTSSGLLAAYGCGAFLGPIVAGALMRVVGPPGMFWWSASVDAALVVFALYRMRRRATKPAEERAPTIPLPGGQHTSGILYAEMRNQMDRDLARMAGGSPRRG